MASAITGCGIGYPNDVLHNHELEKLFGIEDSWIVERTGIRSRQISGIDQSCVSLATEACRAAMLDAETEPAEVDHVIVATTTPDERMPATAPSVQRALGISDAGAFDVHAACSGFLYGLAVAQSMIESGAARRVLVCGVEVLSRVVDYSDRNSCILFGDGAGAVVLEKGEGGGRVGPFTLRSDGSGASMLHISASNGLIEMQGREVYRWAVEKMCLSIEELLHKAGLAPDEIDIFVGHQANERILRAVASRVGMTDRAFVNIGNWGNTSAASIPIALTEASAQGLLKEDDVVLLAAFGAGFVWGAGLVRWGSPLVTRLPVMDEVAVDV
jgi:3-oxoacyl-[acyl-carrier-protein] synthase-3